MVIHSKKEYARRERQNNSKYLDQRRCSTSLESNGKMVEIFRDEHLHRRCQMVFANGEAPSDNGILHDQHWRALRVLAIIQILETIRQMIVENTGDQTVAIVYTNVQSRIRWEILFIRLIEQHFVVLQVQHPGGNGGRPCGGWLKTIRFRAPKRIN